MPRVRTVKNQGRSKSTMLCCRCGKPIVKGETYYLWALKRQRGGVVKTQHTSHGPVRQSQLTEGALQPVYAAIEDGEDALAAAGSKDAVIEALDSLKSSIEQEREEMESRLDNMPEGLRDGSTGQLLQERIEALSDFESELDSAMSDVESIEDAEEPEEPEEGEEAQEPERTEDDVLDEARSRAEDAMSSLSI